MYWNFDEIILTSGSPRITNRDRPLTVEIGFGNGEYLAHLATSRPDRLVVGIEVSQWCVAKAARRALSENLGNVRLLHGDARYLLKLAFEPRSISDVFMNFPCPWPKKRHTERRVARPQFAALMSGALEEGGKFTLATDVDWYAQDTLGVFSSDARFETCGIEKNPERDYITKYERKWRKMGRDTYVTTATKVGETGADFENCGDPADSPELAEPAGKAMDIKELAMSVRGDVIEGDAYRVIFREVFAAEDGTAIILVISVDEGFEQHYYLKIVRSGGCVRGKIDSVGHPYKTPGVRASVRHLMKKAGVKF